MSATALKLPAPLVTVRHPLKFIKNKALLAIDGMALGHVGLLIIVALYYLVLQTSTFNWLVHLFGWHGSVKSMWHSLVPNSTNRHNIRDGGEGFLGGMLGQAIIWNHYKKNVKKRHILDKIEIFARIPNVKHVARLRAWQYPYGLVMSLAYGVPGFFLGTWVVNKIAHALNYAAPYVNSHSAYYQKVVSIWTGSAPHIVIGLFASLLFARRPLKKLYDDLQLSLAERRIALGKPVRFYHSPTFQARYNENLSRKTAIKVDWHGSPNTVPALLMIGMLAGVILAGYGYYVMTVIAVPK